LSASDMVKLAAQRLSGTLFLATLASCEVVAAVAKWWEEKEGGGVGGEVVLLWTAVASLLPVVAQLWEWWPWRRIRCATRRKRNFSGKFTTENWCSGTSLAAAVRGGLTGSRRKECANTEADDICEQQQEEELKKKKHAPCFLSDHQAHSHSSSACSISHHPPPPRPAAPNRIPPPPLLLVSRLGPHPPMARQFAPFGTETTLRYRRRDSRPRIHSPPPPPASFAACRRSRC